jgi:hypothetical protein
MSSTGGVMGLFAEYMQTRLNEMANTISQVLDQKEKEGQMPYGSIWTDTVVMQKRLGLTPEQIQSMRQNGALLKVQNGWQIDKSKLQQYPQMGTAPPVPQAGINPQVNFAGTTPAIQGLR